MMILPALRDRVRNGYYTTYPGKAPATLEALLNEVEKQEADLAAAQERIAALEAANDLLRTALEHIERNAPSIAPQQPSLIDYAACWAFWVAGNVAREALQAKGAE